MYNFLIVDDEEFICDSLFQIFSNQKDLDLEIHQAYSARGALELLNRQRFDIVMTDIEMPGMSGIELMKEITGRWINCRVIFLTAHSKFEYIYLTSREKNTKYILKTESIENIIQTVRETIGEIEQQNMNEELLSHSARRDFEKTWYCRYIVADLIRGCLSLEHFKAQLPALFPLDLDMPVLMFIGTVESSSKNAAAPHQDLWLYRDIMLQVEESLADRCSLLGAILEPEYMVWLVQPKDFSSYITEEDKSRMCFSLVNGNLPVIQSMIRKSMNVSMNFALFSQLVAWKAIQRTYETLKKLYFYNHRISSDEILLFDPDGDTQIKKAEPLSAQPFFNPEDFERLIREGDREELEKYFTRISQTPSSNLQDPYYCYEAFAILSGALISIMSRYQLTNLVNRQYPVEKLVSYSLHSSWLSAVEYLKQVTVRIAEFRGNYSENAANKITHAVNDYITAHLEEDLSLTRLADLFHYNPSYLSRIYKEVTGENLRQHRAEEKW